MRGHDTLNLPKPLLDIGESLKCCFDNGHYVATLILIYTYIDALASLIMSPDKKEVSRQDFIFWVEKYMKTDPSQSYQYKGIDLWGARCGLVHRYSPSSKYSDNGTCKLFAYTTEKDHKYNPDIDANLVLISIPRFFRDFIGAIKNFLDDLISNDNLRRRAESRFKDFFVIQDI